MWGLGTMLGIAGMGFVYRHFFVADSLWPSPDAIFLIVAGSVAMGLGLALLKHNVVNIDGFVRNGMSLLRSLIGAICIAFSILSAGMISQEMAAQIAPKVHYGELAIIALIGGSITGLALFYLGRRR